MKKVLKSLIVLFSFFGFGLIFLGALYKIQSWQMPAIGGLRIDLLTLGGVSLVVAGLVLTALILQKIWFKKEPREERLELDEQRLRAPARKTPLNNEDELML